MVERDRESGEIFSHALVNISPSSVGMFGHIHTGVGGRAERETYLHALTLHLGDAGGGNGVQLEAEVRRAGGDLS